MESGIYRDYWVLPNRSWWLGFSKARKLLRSGKSLRGMLKPDMYTPLRTAKFLDLLYSSMSGSKESELRSRILTCDNLNPILLEIDIAAHLVLKGYSIQWSEAGAPNLDRAPELIARRGEAEVEVECKTKGVDAGRRVPRRTFYRLADRLVALVRKSQLMGNMVITIADRLPTSQEWHDQLVLHVSENIGSLREHLNLEDGSVIEISLKSPTDLILDPGYVLSQAHKDRNPYSHIVVTADQVDGGITNPITVRVKSQAPDRLLDDVLDDLRDANRQLSGKRPGLIVCYIPEVETFEGLGEESALKNMTARFFIQYSCDCVSSVIFTYSLKGYTLLSVFPAAKLTRHQTGRTCFPAWG